jgi:hypothetical protein
MLLSRGAGVPSPPASPLFLFLFPRHLDSTQSDKQIYFKLPPARKRNRGKPKAERRIRLCYIADSGKEKRNKNRIVHEICKKILWRRKLYAEILHLRIQLHHKAREREREREGKERPQSTDYFFLFFSTKQHRRPHVTFTDRSILKQQILIFLLNWHSANAQIFL